MNFFKNNKKVLTKVGSFIPFFVFLFYIIYIHFNISPISCDDVFFSQQKGNLFSIIINRYNGWSSRVLIETVLISILTYAKFLWKIIDISMCLLLYYSLNKIFNKDKSIFIKYCICFLLIIFPFNLFSGAGWGATTVNYLWPLSLGMFSMIPIINELGSEKYNKKILILTLPSLLFAANQEQLCALLFGFLLIFNVYYYIKNKKFNKVLILYFILTILSLIFILTCPGNHLRDISEINNWFIDFKKLTLIDRLMIGINHSFSVLLCNYNYIFIIMISLLLYELYKNKKPIYFKILAFILLVGAIVIPRYGIFHNLDQLYAGFTKGEVVIPILKLHSKSFYLSIVISLFYLVSIVLLLYKTFSNDKYKKLFIPIVFIAGILSRFIIVFSPTVFASGPRTSIFMIFLILLLCILNIKNMKLTKVNKKSILIYLFIMVLLAKFFIINLNVRLF